ncbi:MAG: hypothetical protein MUE49_14840 [Rhodospirillales bacterium]|jgi:hypothetical protein|nr:hypothetical protein [Rhodospirillales bacterium]
MRGLTKTITVAGQEITVREVSVGEIRAWLKEIELEDTDVMDVALQKGWHMSAVRLITGLSRDQLDEFLPSERRVIAQTAEAVNGDFFDLIRAALGPVLSRLSGKS